MKWEHKMSEHPSFLYLPPVIWKKLLMTSGFVPLSTHILSMRQYENELLLAINHLPRLRFIPP